MVIQDSYRSYKTYTYSELIFNKIMFIQDSRRSYRTYTYLIDTGVPIGTTELIQDLYLFYGYGSTRRYYRAYTGLILILRIREYS